MIRPDVLSRFAAACLLAALQGSVLGGEGAGPTPDAVVASDGSGNYGTVQEAVNKAPQNVPREKPWTILVKAGAYREIVYIQHEKRNVRLIGEGRDRTVISYSVSPKTKGPDGMEIGTFRTPVLTVDADDFSIENLTVENTAGAVGPALALRVDGDRVIFRDCRFSGFQDTVFLNRGRQYFSGCTITGAVDFIFGAAAAYFDECRIECLRDGYVTAASTPADQAYGFVFRNCTIASSDPAVKSYLGRPWRAHASTIFLGCEMSGVVRPAGWHNWNKNDLEGTFRYSESGSRGEGGDPSARVQWAKPLSPAEARKITPPVVLGGWDPRGSRN